jgi:hypothetical protein
MQKKISKYELWFHNKWRPAIAWQYFIVNIFDFIIGPYAHTLFENLILSPDKVSSWQPLTLQGGGLYHISMLTIIGATTWQRTKEKLELMKTGSNVEPDILNDEPPGVK